MLRAWVISGLSFMALPGTLLGFSNLLAISTHHGLGTLPPAWMEGHGHAQMFGWIGSFILGIGFYSQPSRGNSVLRIPLTCWALWTSGVVLRWFANIDAWHWRTLFVVSSTAELMTLLLFLSAARHHKMPESGQTRSKRRIEPWMISVFVGTGGLLVGVVFNFVECIRLAAVGTSESFPHALDQRYLVILGWGFLAPTVWGFSARWLPTFLGIGEPRERLFRSALIMDVAAILLALFGFLSFATITLTCMCVAVLLALRLVESPQNTLKPKVQGIHPSFPVFIRMAYVWLVIAGGMSVWAALADLHNGIWGASRHALTVGFAATMVFAIGPRILPHFGGVYNLFSKNLMLASLLLLQAGCTLRVSSEPLAYEGLSTFAWKVLPVSASLELAGVLIFALNLTMTYAKGKAFLAAEPNPNA
jgi:voltage-gated potassium channel Kch